MDVKRTWCSIVPSHILQNIATKGNAKQRKAAREALEISGFFRGRRDAIAGIAPLVTLATGEKRRTVYDAQHKSKLPGQLVRAEGDPKSKDASVNEAYDGAGKTYDFYYDVYERNSIDGKGMRLDSSVHYRTNFDNAFWDGQQMVYGDGDGEIFNGFTGCLDVIGHELTHGVTQFESDLQYQDQSGSLNEHFSDAFGSLVKQFNNKETADKADWLIGAGLFTKKIKGVALRSMKAPGTAYDDPLIGKDPQPAHMRDYVDTTDDNGGVHTNSGIPNKAFCDLAIALGGYAWLKAGLIWYRTLVEKIQPETDFAGCKAMTLEVAETLYGKSSAEQEAVAAAWEGVGV
jgi:Zn-dependent metalloprotease